MGLFKDILISYRKMKRVPYNTIHYGLFEKEERLFTFTIYNGILNNVERYIINVHKCQIDDVQKIDHGNIILFSVMDENLKARTLILKREGVNYYG